MALQVGRTDVDNLLAEHTAAEWTEWMAYFMVHPFGETRADLRSAIVACVIANANRASHSAPYKPYDFMPFQEAERTVEVPKTLDEMKRQLRAAFGA